MKPLPTTLLVIATLRQVVVADRVDQRPLSTAPPSPGDPAPESLQDLVTVLPVKRRSPIPVNINTASAETLAAALDGVSVFHYDYYAAHEPQPRNIADLDADGDADGDDYSAFESFLGGPAAVATGLPLSTPLHLVA